MPQTPEGAKKTSATNKAKYGPDFYARIGAMGGRKGRTGGFYENRETARTAGAKGGRHSKRGHRFLFEDENYRHFQNLKTGETVRLKNDA